MKFNEYLCMHVLLFIIKIDIIKRQKFSNKKRHRGKGVQSLSICSLIF